MILNLQNQKKDDTCDGIWKAQKEKYLMGQQGIDWNIPLPISSSRTWGGEKSYDTDKNSLQR